MLKKPRRKLAEALTLQSTSIRFGFGDPTVSQILSTNTNNKGSLSRLKDLLLASPEDLANNGLVIKMITIAPTKIGAMYNKKAKIAALPRADSKITV